MSNEIYGFVNLPAPLTAEEAKSALAAMTPLGVFSVSKDCLLGFPPHLTPCRDALIFVVGDSPASMNAEYLLDYQDYDPQSDIMLPLAAEDRLALVVELFENMISSLGCTQVVACLTVCNQVDEVKHIPASAVWASLRADCVAECPPCKIYIITPAA